LLALIRSHIGRRKVTAGSTKTVTYTSVQMATTMLSNHHSSQPSGHYGYAAPPSPPLDESSRCSLPSISNLLGLADQGSPTSETSPQNQQQQGRICPVSFLRPVTNTASQHNLQSQRRGLTHPTMATMRWRDLYFHLHRQ
jgi:hypothetical protein